jgi:hypothetical protein
MDGPLILPPSPQLQLPSKQESEDIISTVTNASDSSGSNIRYSYNPLYELSEDFRHAVRLAMFPNLYKNVRTNAPISKDNSRRKTDDDYSSSYSLGLQPYHPRRFDEIDNNDKNKSDDEDETDEENIELELEKLLNQELRQNLQQKPQRWRSFVPSLSIPLVRNNKPKMSSTIDVLNRNNSPNQPLWDYNQATEGEFLYYQRNPMMSALNSRAGTSSFVGGRRSLAELTVYCPQTFRNLRNDVFKIPEQEYLESMLSSGPFVSFQSNSKGAARVGGVFFFTRDGKYMIKTIKSEEASTLLNILPKYHRHYQKFGRSSLLTRFCGMYGVRICEEEEENVDERGESSSSSKSIPDGKLYTFIVMNSVFPAEANSFISERFDLKGSTVGREVSEEELQKKGSAAVLKDLDLSREVDLVRSMQANKKGKTVDDDNSMVNGEYGLVIGAHAKAALLSQLREDVKLLVDCQVMDYSLLVGIVHMDHRRKRSKLTRQAMYKVRMSDRLLSAQSNPKKDSLALYRLTMPFRLLISPPIYLMRRTWDIARLTIDSFITAPMPYFGSGQCGIDGGKLSILNGKRQGDRAVYYIGLIDFLQPWTTRKIIERQLKGILGYDVKAISSVPPDEYADRFLKFINDNVS